MFKFRNILLIGLLTLLFTKNAFGAAEEHTTGHGASAVVFFWIALILLAAKASSLVEKFGQPSVLGELVIGVILGNLSLIGFHYFDAVKSDSIINFLAELGVVILLFQIGLESNIQKMKEVGIRALMVAVVGVVAPFVLGAYLVGPLLMPGMDTNTYLFIGAALTATSVGITARVFKDLKKLNSPEAQIVLGAAVIDDVIGLIILAVVSAIVTIGAVSLGTVSVIIAKAIFFLIGSIVLGQLIAKGFGRTFSKIHTGLGMKFAVAISFGLIFAYLAQLIGLAPIVGAFAAGLVLDPVHFKFFEDPSIVTDLRRSVKGASGKVKKQINEVIAHHSHRHIEDLIDPISHFLVPIFFVVTGMSVNLETLFDIPVLLIALGLTAAAFVGKIISGIVAGPVKKHIVGFGMVPRGEVGLIFATIGRSLGVVNDTVFSVIVIMVILTTLLTPPILSSFLKKS